MGLPTGIGLAELGHTVVCVDKIAEKVDALSAGKATIYEEGMEGLFQKHLKSGALSFTLDRAKAVGGADVVMLAVGTPPHPVTKEADLKYIYAAAEELAGCLDGYTVVATKSTVPVGTGDEVEAIIRRVNPSADFDVVSLPEFLREGFAIHDFFNPDRIVIGSIFARDEALFRREMEEVLKKEALAPSLACCEILPAALGDRIGDVAALTVAMEGENLTGNR